MAMGAGAKPALAFFLPKKILPRCCATPKIKHTHGLVVPHKCQNPGQQIIAVPGFARPDY
jgi:hypothetical protein